MSCVSNFSGAPIYIDRLIAITGGKEIRSISDTNRRHAIHGVILGSLCPGPRSHRQVIEQ